MANTYTVKSGDTLSGIGAKLGVDYKTITGYKSGNPNLIYPGETLTWGQQTPNTPQTTTSTPQTDQTAQPLTNPSEVSSYLNQVQSDVASTREAIGMPYKTNEQIKTEISGLTPTTGLPEKPNYEQSYNAMRSDYGLDSIEKDLTDLTAQQQTEEANLRQRTMNEEGKQVPLNVISGRVSEEQRQAQQTLDFIGRQISYKTMQVQAAYKTIDTIMNLKQMDYQTAFTEYNTLLNNNMNMYKLLSDETYKNADMNYKIMTDNKNYALSNLQVWSKLITDGNMDYNSMSTDAKLMINKMEVQSGLGVGFLSNLRMTPGANIKNISERTDANGNKYADILYVNPDGSIRVESKYLGKASTSKTTTANKTVAPVGVGNVGASGGSDYSYLENPNDNYTVDTSFYMSKLEKDDVGGKMNEISGGTKEVDQGTANKMLQSIIDLYKYSYDYSDSEAVNKAQQAFVQIWEQNGYTKAK